jgi:UDP-N-acetylglucosamine 2-epimerase (non-hydrolysing)
VQDSFEIAVILGTRPELIKLAPVINALKNTAPVRAHVILTNQHTGLLKGLVELFDLPAPVQLPLENQAPNLPQLTSQLIHHIDRHISGMKSCDAIIVQGDTTTALTAAQVGFYRGIPVAHVEAGLRTWDLTQPFPEEFNRQVVGKVANLHFCPTSGSAENLRREGIPAERIHVVGNTVIDALNYVRARKLNASYAQTELKSESPELAYALELFKRTGGTSMALMTLHRRESQGEGQERIFAAIRDFAAEHPGHHFVYPYHLNPKVRIPAFKYLADIPNIHLIPPLSYRPMVFLLGTVDFAVSDSGGIQEEIPTFRKPLLIMRNRTERPEVVDAGFGRLVGHDVKELTRLMADLVTASAKKTQPRWYKPSGENPFGDGTSSVKIGDILLDTLRASARKIKAKAA